MDLETSRANTVQLGLRITGLEGMGFVLRGLWPECFAGHLDILRLMTRGFARRRRMGLIRCSNRRMALCQAWSDCSGARGGKVALRR